MWTPHHKPVKLPWTFPGAPLTFNRAPWDFQGADSIKRINDASYDRLISTMGFPTLVRCNLYIESGPRVTWQVWCCNICILNICRDLSKHCSNLTLHCSPNASETRTTRTPAFWGYPPDAPWLPHTIDQFILNPKSILLTSWYQILSQNKVKAEKLEKLAKNWNFRILL